MNCSYHITVGSGKAVVLKYVITVQLVIKVTGWCLIMIDNFPSVFPFLREMRNGYWSHLLSESLTSFSVADMQNITITVASHFG